MEFSLLRLDAQSSDFDAQLKKLIAWEDISDQVVEDRVRDILSDVRTRGDAALLELTRRFDNNPVDNVGDLWVDLNFNPEDLIPPEQYQALLTAAERIRVFHQHQLQESWSFSDAYGNQLGQQVTPLERVGIYVPGGKAAYPSSVLMNAIPAQVAGVKDIIMVSPTPNGDLNPTVLAAAKIAGVSHFCCVGGAQAVAALAYGTDSMKPVDKIVGPGNIYVATAKKQLFGKVGLDMIAGPSEILVIGDGSVDPDWIAMDLLSQAEHDEQAQPILLSPDEAYLSQVADSLMALTPTLERAEIAAASLANRAALILVKDLSQAVDIANQIAPEHLELAVEDPEYWRKGIRNAGALFLGRFTAEAVGDYCAGPNHVLPTSATARFASPLGVYDFQKRMSVIACSEQGADQIGRVASVLARAESLTAHARSAEYRIKS